MPSKIIKVAIIDDHEILREGLKQLLNAADGLQVVAEGASAAEAVSLCQRAAPDVMLLDISLPDRNGIEALKMIRERCQHTAVLMLSSHSEEQYAVRAIRSGAAGYLTKNSASIELVRAIQQIAAGKKYITPEVAVALAEQISDNSEKPLHETLSDREYQTMTMLASGLTVSEIAERLSLSVKTISMYRARLLDKMKMRHNAELTHYAVKNNLVD